MPSHKEVTPKAEQFGLYQKRALVSLYFGSVINGSAIMLCGIFVIYIPLHRCYIPEIDDYVNTSSVWPAIAFESISTASNDSSHEAMINLSIYIPIEEGPDGQPRWSQCCRYMGNSHESANSSFNRTTIQCDQGWKYFPLAEEVSAVMEFDLVCDRAWLGPLAPSVMMLGVMFGSIVGGYISDRYGRRFTLLVWWVIMCVCSVALAVLPTWKITFLFWFIGGAVAFIRSVITMILVNEVTPSKYRHVAGVANMHAVAIGYMLTPMICYFLKNWRYVMGAYAVLHIAGFFPVFFWVKESVRWLLEKGKCKEANTVVREIKKINNESPEMEEIPFNSTTKTKNHEKESSKSTHQLSYLDLLKVGFLRKRLLIFGMSWFAATMNYHGLSIHTNSLGGNRYIACFIAGGVEIPGQLLCLASIKKFGGRVTAILSTGLNGLCLLLIPLFIQAASRASVNVFSMIAKLFITGSLTNIFIFKGDLFPTLLRNQAYGAGSFLGRFAGIAIPFILYLGTTYHESIPYLIMGSTAIAAAIGMFFIPETKGTPIPDTMEDARNQERLIKTRCCCHAENMRDEIVGDTDEELSAAQIMKV